MNTTKVMPTEGQFVAVWEYNGEMWSDTCRMVDGNFQVFITGTDGEDEHWTNESGDLAESIDVTYITNNNNGAIK